MQLHRGNFVSYVALLPSVPFPLYIVLVLFSITLILDMKPKHIM